MANNSVNPTVEYLRHIPRIKSKVEGLQLILQNGHCVRAGEETQIPFHRHLRIQGVSVRVLNYLLPENAKDTYDAQVNPSMTNFPLQDTWPYVFHDLLTWFLTGDLLQIAFQAVRSAEKGAPEAEMQFTQHISDGSLEGRNFCKHYGFMKDFVRRLPEATMERASEEMPTLPSLIRTALFWREI